MLSRRSFVVSSLLSSGLGALVKIFGLGSENPTKVTKPSREFEPQYFVNRDPKPVEFWHPGVNSCGIAKCSLMCWYGTGFKVHFPSDPLATVSTQWVAGIDVPDYTRITLKFGDGLELMVQSFDRPFFSIWSYMGKPLLETMLVCMESPSKEEQITNVLRGIKSEQTDKEKLRELIHGLKVCVSNVSPDELSKTLGKSSTIIGNTVKFVQ